MASPDTLTLVLPGKTKDVLTRYRNPDGSIGGWVAANADIHKTTHIEFTAIVGPNISLGRNSYVGEYSIMVQ